MPRLREIFLDLTARWKRNNKFLWRVFPFFCALCLIAGAIFFVYSPRTALIIDQLSLGYPRPQIIETITRLLRNNGYTVRYVPYQDVSVEFFRTLPTLRADLILLRIHSSARIYAPNNEVVEDASVSLCTGEPVSQKYRQERNSGQLGGFETAGADTLFFSVRDAFFRRNAVGRFNQAVILMMGCESLRIPSTAQTFLDMGAQAIVGWSDQLSVEYMDQATIALLEEWIHNGQSLAEAIKITQRRIGRDSYYPKTELRLLQQSDTAERTTP